MTSASHVASSTFSASPATSHSSFAESTTIFEIGTASYTSPLRGVKSHRLAHHITRASQAARMPAPIRTHRQRRRHVGLFVYGRLDPCSRNTRKDIRWIDQTLRATGRKVEIQMPHRYPLIGPGQRVGIGIKCLLHIGREFHQGMRHDFLPANFDHPPIIVRGKIELGPLKLCERIVPARRRQISAANP